MICSRQLQVLRYGMGRFLSSSQKAEENLTNVSPSEIRNVGIVAHIDAGKTTLTERMLYLAGVIRRMGDVPSGNTVTDFLDLERERGITIQLAAITFIWKKHRINLIDTPGHVDFTVEVERCARVLDGVITVLDGSTGVQAQTITVWRQAAKFRLPSIFFINKLDRKETNFLRSVGTIEHKLGIKALVTASPYYNDGVISGVVDVIAKKHIPISSNGQWNNIESHIGEFLRANRENLCCELSDLDPEFMSLFLEQYSGDALSVPSSIIIKALRLIVLSNRASVVTSGSAFRCPASVKSVLDHTIQFLPSPIERNTDLKKLFNNELCVLVFKIGHDKRKGKLSFVRVYTGVLNSNSFLYNSTRGTIEGPVKLFIAQSSELLPISSVSEGNIAVVSGLSSAVTGDTILSSQSITHQCGARKGYHSRPHGNALENSTLPTSTYDITNDFIRGEQIITESSDDAKNTVLEGIDTPDPVYFCCVEPPSTKSIHEFERALKELAVEDPSLRIRYDAETGQTVVETMGELHMDIVKNRLIRDYGLNVFVGPLQVAYREIIEGEVSQTATVQEIFDGKEVHSATLTLHIEPKSRIGKFKGVQVNLAPDSLNLRRDWLKAINEGCRNALHNGPVLGFPVQDVMITLEAFTASGGRVNPAILSSCAHKCVTKAFESVIARLIEPIMRVDITLESGTEAQTLLHELTRRRAAIIDCSGTHLGATIIQANMPVSEMAGFPTTLRTLSSGLASLHVQVSDYQPVPSHEQIGVINRLKHIK